VIGWRATIAIFSTLTVMGCSGSNAPAGPADMAPPSPSALLASRPYSAIVPPGYDAAKTWPLLIVLAGAGGIGADTSAYLGFTQLAADQAIFLVTPDADAPNGRFSWNPNPAPFPTFDVEYLTAIIHDLEGKYSIDRGRVFVAGHSLGAHMAHRMACDDAADVVAIMSLAGQVSKNPGDCRPSRAVSVVQVHGTFDSAIGYTGDVQHDPPDPTVPSAHDTVATWARNDVCAGGIANTGVTLDLDSTLAGNETTVEAYAGCPGGSGVELWSIVGGTHRPALTPAFAGLVWGFLTAHVRQ
jgi:polyhydroxybutyrate depolymerase